ncbi:MAG TPA: NAD-dependent deacylase [Longimicrobiales bacterium]|nr:NAD-dependent deacylase [Longimicrobiales bacterium]
MATIQIPDRLVERLRAAEHVVALTGAGISAESGLPTFREKQTGLWARYRPEELATPEAFARQPDLVWKWYEWRRSLVAAAEPNAGHLALVALERRAPRFTLITQNVDGLHHRAGSRNVVELHGRITRTKCSVEGRIVDTWPETEEVPPRCPSCGAPLRPDVVWFGEPLPEEAFRRAVDAASACDVFLSIGTSGVVFPAASLLPLAARSGATVAVVNTRPQEGGLVPDAYLLLGPAAAMLPALVRAVWPEERTVH